MSVYVDAGNNRYGRMRMCYMLADTPVELLNMADRIGAKRKWLQSAGTYREHFDICLVKRKLGNYILDSHGGFMKSKDGSCQNDLCECGHIRGQHAPTHYYSDDKSCAQCDCKEFKEAGS